MNLASLQVQVDDRQNIVFFWKSPLMEPTCFFWVSLYNWLANTQVVIVLGSELADAWDQPEVPQLLSSLEWLEKIDFWLLCIRHLFLKRLCWLSSAQTSSDLQKSCPCSVATGFPQNLGCLFHVSDSVYFLQGWLQDEKVLEEATQKVALLHQKYR